MQFTVGSSRDRIFGFSRCTITLDSTPSDQEERDGTLLPRCEHGPAVQVRSMDDDVRGNLRKGLTYLISEWNISASGTLYPTTYHFYTQH